MIRTGFIVTMGITALVGQAAAQIDDNASEIRRLTMLNNSNNPVLLPRQDLIAALPWDGVELTGSKGQDFESIFDAYDIFIIEDIQPSSDAVLGEFRSRAFGTENPFGAEDFVVRIFENDGSGLPGENDYTGELVFTTVPGAGFYDGEDYVTDFGNQCMTPKPYFIVWHARMDFTTFGQAFFPHQAGEPTVGGGEPDNAWLWAPGDGYGLGTHFPARDFDGNHTGVNYLLFGDESNCGCENPDCAADLDRDGDADSDDFFLYLDLFETGDECADLDLDGDLDADDFFAYLDLFAAGC